MRTLIVTVVLTLFSAAPAGPATGSEPGGPAAPAGPLEEFQPSTRLPVGQAVAFPVDI